MATVVGNLVAILGANTAAFDRAMSGAAKTLNKVGAQMGATGRTLSKTITLPILGVGIAAVKSFADFDEAMTSSTAIMGELSEEMRGKLSDAARQVALTTSFSAKEAADSYFFLASAGLNAAQSIEALPKVAAFAQAGNFDMALATDLLTDAQSALGMTIRDDVVANMENMTRVSDVLVKANVLSNATVQQFSESLTNKAGAAMKQLGIEIESGVAVLAAWADQGLKGSEAGDAFNIVTRDLQKAFADNTAIFQQYNVAVYDAQGNFRNMSDIIADLEGALEGQSAQMQRNILSAMGFQDRSIAFTRSLIGTSEAIKSYEENLRLAGGVTDEIAQKQLQTFWKQMGLLKDLAIDLAIQLGEVLVPQIQALATWIREELVPRLQKWIDWFKKLSPEMQKFVIGVAALAAAIGPVLIVLGLMLPALALLLGPIGLVTVAIAGLAVAGIYIYTHWEEIKDKLAALWEIIKEIFSRALHAILGGIKWYLGLYLKPWIIMGEGIKGAIDFVIDATKLLIEGAKAAYEGAKNWLQDKLGGLIDAVKGIGEKIADEWKDKIMPVVGVAQIVSGAVIKGFKDDLQGLPDDTGDIADETASWWKRAGKAISDATAAAYGAVVKWLVDKLEDLPDKVQELLQSVGQMWIAGRALIVETVKGTRDEIVLWFTTKLADLADVVYDVAIQPMINAWGWFKEQVGSILQSLGELLQKYLVESLENAFGKVVGVLDALQKAFEELYEMIVGESIIPDLVEGIGFQIKRLDDEMVKPVQGAVEEVEKAFADAGFAADLKGGRITLYLDREVVELMRESLEEHPREIDRALRDWMRDLREWQAKLLSALGVWGEGFRSGLIDALDAFLSEIREVMSSASSKIKTAAGTMESVFSTGQGSWLGKMESLFSTTAAGSFYKSLSTRFDTFEKEIKKVFGAEKDGFRAHLVTLLSSGEGTFLAGFTDILNPKKKDGWIDTLIQAFKGGEIEAWKNRVAGIFSLLEGSFYANLSNLYFGATGFLAQLGAQLTTHKTEMERILEAHISNLSSVLSQFLTEFKGGPVTIGPPTEPPEEESPEEEPPTGRPIYTKAGGRRYSITVYANEVAFGINDLRRLMNQMELLYG